MCILATAHPPWTALQERPALYRSSSLQVADPVGSGLVANLARPGGNVTGFIQFEYGIGGKWLEAAQGDRAGRRARRLVLYNPATFGTRPGRAAIQAVAPSFGVEVEHARCARRRPRSARRSRQFAREPHGGLIVTARRAPVRRHREQIIALAARHRLPAVYPHRVLCRRAEA